MLKPRLSIQLLMLVVMCTASLGEAEEAVDPVMNQQPAISLDPLSGRSLFLKLTLANQQIGTATGFVVVWGGEHYLVTNWHVLTGRNPATNEPISLIPNAVAIFHHGNQLGSWIEKTEPLYDGQGNPRWIEHPTGRQVDVALLPLQFVDNSITIHAFDLSLANADMMPKVAMPVSIIGFPLGLTGSGFFPIWKTGHIASEPELKYKDQPVFLIDATTKGGMSGSPVVLRLSGGYKTRSGGTVMSSAGYRTRFLGVYAGRIGGDSDVGLVWRSSVIDDILNEIGQPAP